MSRYLAGFAALALIGAAALPLQANAAERSNASQPSGPNAVSTQSTTLSAQRHWRYHHRYWGPRYRYWGPRYGYYGGPYYGYPYRYYRPGPVFGFGIGPFGFGVY